MKNKKKKMHPKQEKKEKVPTKSRENTVCKNKKKIIVSLKSKEK